MIPRRDRAGGFLLVIVILVVAILLLGALITAQQRQDLTSQLVRSIGGHEVEHLVLESLEEGHYLLSMGLLNFDSRSAAQAEVDRATALGPTAEGPKSYGVPDLPAATGALTPVANKFLVEGSGTLYLAATGVASTVPRGGNIRLGPVAVRVVDRLVGKQVQSPHEGEYVPTAAQLAELGLPVGVAALRSVWGVVELSCDAQLRAGDRVKVYRAAVRRKLFAVIDYKYEGDTPRSYAHIFPQSIGQVVIRDPGFTLF